MPRVRLAGFGASSIDVEVRAYVDTTDIHEFMAVQETLLGRILGLVEAAGTSLAFPSTTTYLSRDGGIKGPEALPAAHEEATTQESMEAAGGPPAEEPEVPQDERSAPG